MSSVALRTRFSAQLISAITEPPMLMLHVVAVLAAFAFPLFIAIVETPILLLVVWPFLFMWIMLVVAAREEVAELPKLYADALTRGDSAAARELDRLSRLAGTDRAGALGFALATSGRYEEAIAALEEAEPGELVDEARRVLARATPFRG